MRALVSAITAVTVILLGGCAGKVERQFPIEFSEENKTPLIKVFIEENESDKVSYIASDILPKNDREALHKSISSTMSSYNEADRSTINDNSKLNVGDSAMVATDFSAGGTAASMGVTVFNAVENLFSVNPDKGVNYKNQIYLTEGYVKPLKARIEAMKLLDTKIKEMAGSFGATVKCIAGCKLLGNKYWLRSYEITGIDYSRLENFDGAYKPKSIVIDLNLGEMKKMQPDPVLENFIGSKAYWMFSDWYGFDLWVGDEYLRDSSGKRIKKPFIKGSSGNRYELNACIHSFAIGRLVRKSIFNQKNMYSINSAKFCDRNNTIVTDGTVYTYEPSDLNGSFVKSKLIN